MNRTQRDRSPLPGGHTGGGVTLVELLVTVTVFLVVTGLALGMMVESDRATREITRYQAAVQYCQNALNEAARTVRCAASPASFPAAIRNTGRLAPTYSRDELSLIVCDAQSPTGFSRVRISTVSKGKTALGIQRRESALTDPATSATVRTLDLGGMAPDHFAPSIRFAYAAAPVPAGLKGLEVAYRDQWTSATPPSGATGPAPAGATGPAPAGATGPAPAGATGPALIRITVQARVEDGAGRRDDITLQTAVIPGMIPPDETARPARPRSAAPSAPTTAPAPTPPPPSTVTPAADAAPPVDNAAATPRAVKILPAADFIKVIDRKKLDQIKKRSGS